MPRLHALELITDAAGDHAVRRDWQALRDAGLRSQLDHTGGTNTPHLTLVSAASLDTGQESAARAGIGPLLPLRAHTSGLAVLGSGPRVTLARLLALSDEVTAAVLQLREASRLDLRPGWLAHVTLVRRLPRADVPTALDVLGHEELDLTFTALRRWDPDLGEVRRIV